VSEAIVLSVSEIEHLVMSALVVRGAYPKSVASLARAVAAAEGHGISSHGLAYLPTYREQLACDRVDPNAIPIRRGAAPGVAVVDAADGFAHPAKDLGLAALCPLAHKQGGQRSRSTTLTIVASLVTIPSELRSENWSALSSPTPGIHSSLRRSEISAWHQSVVPCRALQ
jgi:hypothetical protein